MESLLYYVLVNTYLGKVDVVRILRSLPYIRAALTPGSVPIAKLVVHLAKVLLHLGVVWVWVTTRIKSYLIVPFPRFEGCFYCTLYPGPPGL